MELIFLTEKLLRQYYKLVIYPVVPLYAKPSDDTFALMFIFCLFSVDEMVANRYELTSSVYRNGKNP